MNRISKLLSKSHTEFIFKKLIPVLLLIISALYLTTVIYRNRESYLTKFDANSVERAYYQSQWSVRNSKHPISDTTLYSYAGYKYVQGRNPILVNPEHPPFAKYMIGLSIIAFNNEKIASLIAGILSLVLIYLVIYSFTKSQLSASGGVFLTTTQSLFINQLVEAPQLDIFQILFFLILVYTFLNYLQKKKILLLLSSGVVWGLLLSIKTFPIYFILFNFWIFIFLIFINWKKRSLKLVKEWIILNLVSIIIFTLTYFSFFIHDGSFRQFLGVQKYILSFYRASTIDTSRLIGDYLSLLILNKWRFWTEGYPILKYNGWSIFWPIIFILGLFSIYKIYGKLKDKRFSHIKNLYLLMVSFFIAYNLFLFATPIYPRYLLFLFIPIIIFISLLVGIYEASRIRQ